MEDKRDVGDPRVKWLRQRREEKKVTRATVGEKGDFRRCGEIRGGAEGGKMEIGKTYRRFSGKALLARVFILDIQSRCISPADISLRGGRCYSINRRSMFSLLLSESIISNRFL